MRDFDEAQTPLTRSAVMALLDEAMVRVALDKVNAGREVQREVLAVDMNLSFMKPAVGSLLATAQVVGGGKTMKRNCATPKVIWWPRPWAPTARKRASVC